MIVQNQNDVTAAVLAELQRAPDARLKEIMSALVRHLHAFTREVKLTEAEFQAAVGYIIALGTFWRMHSPATRNGDSIVRSPTPGPAMFVHAWFRDRDRKPVAGAEVDVWHSSPEGFYENQDPVQADMNLRGKFLTDADGHIAFRSVKPAGYPIPIDGPVGEMLRALRRHNMRPAHLHFLAVKDGFKTLVSQVYVNDDPYLETDVQFGVTRHLIGNYIRHENEPAPAPDVTGPWYSLDYTFVMEPGNARLPYHFRHFLAQLALARRTKKCHRTALGTCRDTSGTPPGHVAADGFR